MAHATEAGNGTRDTAAKRAKEGTGWASPIAGAAHTLHTTGRGKGDGPRREARPRGGRALYFAIWVFGLLPLRLF